MSRTEYGLALCVVAVGCGMAPGGAEQQAAQRQPVRRGESSLERAVVALVPRRSHCDAPPRDVTCSGVLIGQRLVLTAAHCVQGSPRGALEVRFAGGSHLGPDTYLGIRASKIHPAYDRAYDDNDLALLYLTEEAPTPPVAFLDEPLDASWLGRSARVVGFGETGDDARLQGGQREGAVTLSAMTEATLSYEASPAMTCRGDSGGPVFVQSGDHERLIAITTSGDAGCEERGVAARLDVQRAEFLSEGFIEAARAPSVTPEIACFAACAVDSDCPGDWVCTSDLAGRQRCQGRDLEPISLGNACRRDGDCPDAACVPFGTECRCARSCPSEAAGSLPEPAGCSLRGPATVSWTPGVVLLLLFHLRGRRKARPRRLSYARGRFSHTCSLH